MISSIVQRAVAGLILAFILGSLGMGQDSKKPAEAELKAEVPELTKFHEVIYKIWHTAWPEKDVAMLKELSPEVETMGNELCQANLPGILREKKSAWDEKVLEMKSILAEYKSAAGGNESDRLMKAAEQLHAQYESMVRLLRPAVKEVDEFHAVLYPLYHYYMPQKDTTNIRKSVVLLREKMSGLSGAILPGRLKDKQVAFNGARERLEAALSSLEHAMTSLAADGLDKYIDVLHSRYEDLNKIFE